MSEKGISVLLEEQRSFPPSGEFSSKAHIKTMAEYEAIYRRSVEDPEGFWAEMAEKNLSWFRKWDRVLEYDFEKPFVKWFSGGKLNASYNCLDRYITTPLRNKAAIIWESDEGRYRTYTYQQLYHEVNRFANVLKKHGVDWIVQLRCCDVTAKTGDAIIKKEVAFVGGKDCTFGVCLSLVEGLAVLEAAADRHHKDTVAMVL